MTPVQPPNGNDFSYWKELLTLTGFGFLWWKNGREVGKVEQTVTTTAAKVKSIEESEYCTKDECDRCRVQCRESINDKLMLALEKRDREFDRKFSHICQGISEIKAEIRK